MSHEKIRKVKIDGPQSNRIHGANIAGRPACGNGSVRAPIDEQPLETTITCGTCLGLPESMFAKDHTSVGKRSRPNSRLIEKGTR